MKEEAFAIIEFEEGNERKTKERQRERERQETSSSWHTSPAQFSMGEVIRV